MTISATKVIKYVGRGSAGYLSTSFLCGTAALLKPIPSLTWEPTMEMPTDPRPSTATALLPGVYRPSTHRLWTCPVSRASARALGKTANPQHVGGKRLPTTVEMTERQSVSQTGRQAGSVRDS